MSTIDLLLVIVMVLFVLNIMRQGWQAISTREMKFEGLGRKGQITGQVVFYYGIARIISGFVALIAVALLIAGADSLAFLVFLLSLGLYLAPVVAMSVQATNEAAKDDEVA
jgi:ABC-type phosphate transport system permease subunit